MNRILITGHRGMLGSELMTYAQEHGHECVGSDLPEQDITKREETVAFAQAQRPDLIIHTASMTAVDDCESEADTAYRINATGTQNVCLAAQQLNAPILYLSSDYVFDGEKTEPYDEWDAPHPLSVYGKSKYAGERFVRSLCPKHYIVRVAWLCGHGGPNFVETILKLAAERDKLRVVDDQQGCPTFVSDLVPEILRLVASNAFGTYHITNGGCTTWYGFAKKIVELASLSARVIPCTTEEFPRPAPRPKNSRLSHRLYDNAIGDRMPNWEDGLQKYLE